ncbi:TonB-dependent receptor [Flavobacterium johnsoniae]|uniref:TonB-dependent receptor, plug n=1 Tax=Flavobacterium johnsoniae (strain ATCC 17061 / DSM 2064 / JCM 8514 / BCRC 14874 / CCUG 350202 / NBRC 14942 / NCIMB 11054 / UW101) TaxID=376686 RepID=A5FLE9_FLAJ1|nr:TonB-dependent receptor [Flavobacterium johnsoniae]ABQ03962.1 TonB-dependent receptor, plug [Flavobacterium johnsoniae UW101]OXE96165.1 TonB-dependent receptor [Flavobacterium johnsoniae UW101]WQG79167.1 TonB-dependent receptor [Flavobacterium johnsoniae UW101]SHK08182.1 outer membrane receptor for ferrienterochelin and colicins [Flavobacterium johnsoniae]
MKYLFLTILIITSKCIYSQNISGKIITNSPVVQGINISLLNTNFKTKTDSLGIYQFLNIPKGTYKIQVTSTGFKPIVQRISLLENQDLNLDFELEEDQNELNEVVVSGTLKPVKRLESAVPVEVYSPVFFKKNPTPSIYDALQNINGVRPQLNCGVCNTGDIHINGLEGPYTLVMIDGMPIVSSLSTVYGLSGIPNSLVERIEIVKGPASSLYGSEAVGGLINIITKNPTNAPAFSADYFTTSYFESNLDLGMKFNAGKKAVSLIGINYFNYDQVIDKDKDNFTDVTLSERISVFNKWSFKRNHNRLFTIAARGMYEDRWGGDIRWEKKYRGGDEIYGESIYTKRAELIGSYQLPFEEKLMFSFSGNVHYQDSRYGTTSYIANQKIGFVQLTWDKKIGRNDLLAGIASRYTYYDDNTPATKEAENTWLPGIFVQDEITFSPKSQVLLGARYDYNSIHGSIFTPRFAYRFKADENTIFRLNAGTGFRVVNLFTEDHAALTGSRDVVIKNDLKPEKSVNVNLNYIQKINFGNGTFMGIETTAFYTRFSNKIISDYETNPNEIIYNNIDGYALSQGISTNIDLNFPSGLKFIVGATVLDNKNVENGISERPYLTENFTGTWSISYKIQPWDLSIDYTGNVYSPMKLPLLSETDPRSPKSPWYSIQNIQFTYSGWKDFEVYGGVKNLLNFTPKQNNPFLISRTNDPFDKNVQYDSAGKVLVTPDNPYGLTFDTTYVYGQNQTIRGFLGLRYTLR